MSYWIGAILFLLIVIFCVLWAALMKCVNRDVDDRPEEDLREKQGSAGVVSDGSGPRSFIRDRFEVRR